MDNKIYSYIETIREALRRIDGEVYVLSNLLNDLELTLGNHSTENKCSSCGGTEQGILVQKNQINRSKESGEAKLLTKINRSLPKWELVQRVFDAVASNGGDVDDLREQWEGFSASTQDEYYWEMIERVLERLPEHKKYTWDYDYFYIFEV